MNYHDSIEKMLIYKAAAFILSIVVGYIILGSMHKSIKYTAIMMILTSIIYLSIEYIATL